MRVMKTPEEIKRGVEYLSITDIAEKVKRFEQGVSYAYTEDVAADALAYIQQLEAQAPRWIPVEESLPAPHEDVAIIIRHHGYTYTRVGWYGHACQWMQAGLGMVEGDVTHWMPMPKPPKEEQHE